MMREGVARRNPAAENVVIQRGDCALSILPQCGGKIASLRVRGHELLQPPLAPIAPRTHAMPFDAADASGWDECLPSVAACAVTTAEGRAQIPDHGDLWRVEWNAQPVAPDASSIAMSAQCFSLPLRLERRLALSEASHGWSLHLDYTLTNLGPSPVPWAWSAHPLFTAAAGDRILLPASIRTLRLEGSAGMRLGRNGDTVSWPMARLAGGGETDLRPAQPIAAGIGDKLFAGPFGPHENWCALERPSTGLRIRVRPDAEKTPYVGLWICYGGWPQRPGPRQMCVALEPATAPVDSLAEQGPWSRSLAARATFSWKMQVDLELMEMEP